MKINIRIYFYARQWSYILEKYKADFDYFHYEAEFVSCFKTTSRGVWLKSFISGLKIVDSISRPLRIYCDNSVAVFMAKNNKSGSQSKHIDIKYLAIRERVKEKKVVIEHVNTELMIADPLTKGMPP